MEQIVTQCVPFIRESILKTAKTLVEDTKLLVAGAASSQEKLAQAAQSSAKTITQLTEVVKLGATSMGSEDPETQVRKTMDSFTLKICHQTRCLGHLWQQLFVFNVFYFHLHLSDPHQIGKRIVSFLSSNLVVIFNIHSELHSYLVFVLLSFGSILSVLMGICFLLLKSHLAQFL